MRTSSVVGRRGALRGLFAETVVTAAALMLLVAGLPGTFPGGSRPALAAWAPPAPTAQTSPAPDSLAGPDETPPAAGSPLQELEEAGATEPIDRLFDQISRTGEVSWRDIVKDILTGKGLDFGRLFHAFSRTLAADLLVNSKVLGRIMLIGVVVACLEVLSQTIAPGGSSRIAMWASHLALIVLAVLSFNEVLKIARASMDTVRTAFFAFIPALTSLSLVSGAPVTASVLHPLVFGMGTLVSVFVTDVAFPMIYTSIALDLAGNLGESDRASGVAHMLRQAAFLGIGVLMACFVGVVIGQKAAAGLADGMAYRTAKYMSSTFIPVAGKLIGDTMDMFFVSAYSLRGALGIVGSIAILGGVFSPFVQILSCLCVWKVAAAVLGPLCGNDVRKSLKSMSDGIVGLSIAVFVTCFCFVICLSLVAHAVKPF